MAGRAGGATPERGRYALSHRAFLSGMGPAAVALAGAEGLTGAHGVARVLAGAATQPLFDRIRDLPPEVTPTGRFFVVSKNPPGCDPKVSLQAWALEITGKVGRPVRLNYEQVRTMPSVRRYHTIECISNEVVGDLVGNALWRGVRFRDLVSAAGGVAPGAVRFALRCADGYSEGLPVAEAMHPGMKNTKWITKIEAVSTQFTGYWQASGWSDEAVAYAGNRGIAGVQISADSGRTWARVEVKKPLGPHAWVLWAGLWRPLRPGEYALQVRARDGGGVLQTAVEAPPLPDGASGYHTVRLRVNP